jgi:hypothetical protein
MSKSEIAAFKRKVAGARKFLAEAQATLKKWEAEDRKRNAALKKKKSK